MAADPSPTPEQSELLAPAGDGQALRAAVANGADAVYFGLADFNARQRAANFTIEELPGVMDYLHAHNVRGYVAFNTLIFSDELEQAAAHLSALAQAGVDAIIVQDLGLALLAHQMIPGVELHASTQMTLTEPLGIAFVQRLGIHRVILARELSLADIGHITRQSPVPVEVFVHGALCVAYSGQCLTSEALGGRSANRGQCAQACRLPYDLIVDGQPRDLGDKAYLLSPKDLAAHDRIGELLAAGVHAFKIEGRLKSAQYVAAATQTYRTALDTPRKSAAATGAIPGAIPGAGGTPEVPGELAQSFSRGFAHGFLDGVNHQELVHGRFPKSRGLRLGTVARRTDAGLVVELDEHAPTQLKPGDGVVFDEGHPEQDEQGGRIFTVRPAPGIPAPGIPAPGIPAPAPGIAPGIRPAHGISRREASAKPPRNSPGTIGQASRRCVEISFARGAVNLNAVALGAIVWKTDDPAVRRRLEQSFARDQVVHRQSLQATVEAWPGRPLQLTLADSAGYQVTVEAAAPLAAALKHPLTVELLRQQLGRLGDTPFELGSLVLTWNGAPAEAAPVMAPKSVLNGLRRQAVEKLLALRQRQSAGAVANPQALTELRAQAAAEARRAGTPGSRGREAPDSDDSSPFSSFRPEGPVHPASEAGGVPSLSILARSLPQLEAIAAWRGRSGAESGAESGGKSGGGVNSGGVYVDFEDPRKYAPAVALAHAAGLAIAVATMRILKPGEQGWLCQVLESGPDAVLVRNLGALAWFRKEAPGMALIGDYSLNVANELTALTLRQAGLSRLTPSYDLNYTQLAAMVRRFAPGLFEVVIHQHMPLFHMEHCVFAATLSGGKDYHDCGRPCEKHQVDLRDRMGVPHPLIPDAGCRNTVFNGQAQSAASYLARFRGLGVRHYRVELLREDASETTQLLDYYQRILMGQEVPRNIPRNSSRSLHVLNHLGVTPGIGGPGIRTSPGTLEFA